MIKMYHFSNVFGSDMSKHQQLSDFGESVTDKTFFRPDISSVRPRLSALAGAEMQGVYDFPDGKDTGDVIQTVLRNRGLDVTEIDAISKAVQDKIDAGIKIDEENLAKKLKEDKVKEVDDYIKSISEVLSDSQNLQNLVKSSSTAQN